MKVGDIVSTKFIHFLQDGDSEVVEELGIVCHVDWTNQTVLVNIPELDMQKWFIRIDLKLEYELEL
jgi:hypothetical protein